MRDQQMETCLLNSTGFTTSLISLHQPNEHAVCSLPDVLETGPLPPKYSLSRKAATGILRRAAKRGRVMPGHLQGALESLARSAPSEPPAPEVGGAVAPTRPPPDSLSPPPSKAADGAGTG